MAALSPANTIPPEQQTLLYSVLNSEGRVSQCNVTTEQAKDFRARTANHFYISDHFISSEGRIDCTAYTERDLEELPNHLSAAIRAGNKKNIKTLDCTNNKAVTDFTLLQLTGKCSELEEVHLEGTSVTEDLQEKTRVHFNQIRAVIAFETAEDDTVLHHGIKCKTSNWQTGEVTDPSFTEPHLDVGGPGKQFANAIAKLKDPKDPDTPLIVELRIGPSYTLTDEDLEAIIPNLIGLKELHINRCPELTRIPPAIAKLEHLETLTCRGCRNFKTSPTGLRDDIDVSIQIPK